jgi:uncharacterized membrane protein YcjF (UPF0283 family)
MRQLHNQSIAMLIKTIAIIVFLAVVISLGKALFHLVKAKDEEQSRKTARALTYRIGISLGLFILLALALLLGLYQPTGIGARIQMQHQQSASEQSQP